MEAEDLLVPRLSLLQATSDAVLSGKQKPGEFFNTILEVAYGESVSIQPLMFKKAQNFWEGRRRRCFSVDGKIGVGNPGGDCRTCAFAQWQDEKKPQCDKVIYWVAQTPNGADFFALDFKRTGLAVGRRIATLCRRHNVNPWGLILTLQSVKTQNDSGTFYMPEIHVDRFATHEEFERGTTAYAAFSSRSLDVHYEEGSE
jgi:hypothetical protein